MMPLKSQPQHPVEGKDSPSPHQVDTSIVLYWLPLGAGGRFVRFNGRVYEAIRARRERRRPLDLYHSALEITVAEGRFVIENSWPIPDRNGAMRGVAVVGPVGNRRLARFRSFRYEIRRWRDGIIADVAESVDSPRRLSNDEDIAHRLLELVETVPPLIWGRDELHLGEMWKLQLGHLVALSAKRSAAREDSPAQGWTCTGVGSRLPHCATINTSIGRGEVDPLWCSVLGLG